jgi:hypothetical protein
MHRAFYVGFVVGITAITPAARADILDDCAQAVEANDIPAVERISINLMGVHPFPVERLEEARECLSFIGQGDFDYDPETLRIDYSDRALAEFEAQRQRQEATLEALETTRQERIDQVAARTVQACRELYIRDWIVAMTSAICQPVFAAVGLPE